MRRDLLLAASREKWAIRSAVLASWLSVDIQAAGRPAKLPAVKGNVAIIPMHGAISQRSSIWSEIFGGVSTESLSAAYARAINDERIGAVVFNVDSPGGTVAGVSEAASIIRQGAAIKPTYAIANSEMASAAYWMASQVGPGHLIASPSADVGSIGVFAMHEDVSQMLADAGVKVTTFSVPEHKTEFSPYSAVSEDATAHAMQKINDTYDRFVADVARGRSATTASVKADYGKGRSFHASDALTRGMVDRVATLPDVVQELMRTSKGGQVTQAASQAIEKELCEAFTLGVVEPIRVPLRRAERSERLFSRI